MKMKYWVLLFALILFTTKAMAGVDSPGMQSDPFISLVGRLHFFQFEFSEMGKKASEHKNFENELRRLKITVNTISIKTNELREWYEKNNHALPMKSSLLVKRVIDSLKDFKGDIPDNSVAVISYLSEVDSFISKNAPSKEEMRGYVQRLRNR